MERVAARSMLLALALGDALLFMALLVPAG